MPSRNLSDLVPLVCNAATAAIAECTAKGYDVLVTCTYRTPEEQNSLYAQGRTAPGPIVTNARANQSMHQFRCALDIVPMFGGKCVWDGSNPLWDEIADIFITNGFEWGENWQQFKEMPHFQITQGYPLAHFQNGGTLE